MSENNLPNIDGEENINTEAQTEENTAPETAADDISAVEDEIFVETEEDAEEDAENAHPQPEQPKAETAYRIRTPEKKSGAGKIIAIVAIIVVLLGAAGFGVYKYMTRNPYNNMGYVNVSGRTIADVYKSAGYSSVDEFLAEYGLPADMPEDTQESAAYYNIPTKKIAEMYGMEVSDLKELLGLGDDVTDDTPWGVAEGKATLGKYIGEDRLEDFKKEYDLGDDVTADTLWGEVRNKVDEKTLEKQEEAKKQQSSQNNNTAVGDDTGAAGDDSVTDDTAENTAE